MIAIYLVPMGYSDAGNPLGLSGDLDIEYVVEGTILCAESEIALSRSR